MLTTTIIEIITIFNMIMMKKKYIEVFNKNLFFINAFQGWLSNKNLGNYFYQFDLCYPVDAALL